MFIMASLRKTREMIVIAYAEGLLTDEEFMFLYETNQPVNLELPCYEYEEFNFDENMMAPNVKQSLGLKEEISNVSLMFLNYRPPLRVHKAVFATEQRAFAYFFVASHIHVVTVTWSADLQNQFLFCVWYRT